MILPADVAIFYLKFLNHDAKYLPENTLLWTINKLIFLYLNMLQQDYVS